MTSLFERLAGLFRDPTATGEPDVSTTADDRTAAPPAEGTTTDEGVRAVAVVLQRAPAGVRRFDLRVACPPASVAGVSPGLLSDHFERVAADAGTVQVRAVDFTGQGRRVTGAVPLVSIRFTEPVPSDAVSLTLEAAVDHDGEAIPREWLRLTPVGPEDVDESRATAGVDATDQATATDRA